MSEERRLVTVLFADVSGSTSLGETLDPEDLRALLARFFAIAREIVGEHGGTIEKFIGDAVMAVFGLPVAHGDDASRAVAAALQLRDAVRDDAGLGERLPIRIGINSGEVVASRDAATDSDFLVTGDAVNVAARLLQSAETWAVVVGERTLNAARDFSYDELRDVEARGKAVPVRAAVVLGRASQERRPLPLLGRQSDLEQLELVARRAFRESRPYLVSVVAPAGTGKTRLLEEFLARLERDNPESLVAKAQCLPYGQRLTFWPLRAIAHTIVGANEETRPEQLRELMVKRLTELRVAEPAHVAARLLATIGAGEEDISDRSDVYAAWRATFERAANERPLVVVFEDLHWSSDSFLDLVEYVTQPRGEARLLMIVLTRPELLDRRPSWGGGKRNHVSLALEPLDEEAIADLVRHLLESASAATIRTVAARAEGNPFYAGELVRSLVDRLGPAAATHDVERSLASLPDTVQATVLARLDALPRFERRALQLGAVFGRSFRPAGIVALEPELEGTVEAAVGSLLDREMTRIAAGDSHEFRHILIREVAYGMLPRAERARLHAAAGGWLERQAAGREEAYAELIAYHYREAATLAALLPDETATEVRTRAVEWLRRAAEMARAAAADIEARGHLANALEWAPRALLPELYERIGDTYIGGDATVEAYATAYRLAGETGRSPDDRLRALAKLIEYEGRFQGSVGTRMSLAAMDELVAEGRELLASATDPAARSRFHIALGFLPWWRRGGGGTSDAPALREAEDDARLGLRYADEADDPTLRSAALDALASLAQEHGDWRQALVYSRRRLEFAERLPVSERIDAQSMVVWNALALGGLAEADRSSADGLSQVQPGQAPSMVLHLVSWRAQVLYDLGRWDEVQALATRAERLWIDLGRPAALYSVRGFISAFDVARARRQPEQLTAWREISEAILAHLPPDDLDTQLMRVYLRGTPEELAAALSRPFERNFFERYARSIARCTDHRQPLGEAVLRALLEQAVEQGTALYEAQTRRALAFSRGDPVEARRALSIFEGTGALPNAARVRCELGLLLHDEEQFEAGARTLTALGDTDQLERYDAWRAGS